MKVAYVRVSSIDQNEVRQIECLNQFGIEKWFTEKVSGKDMERPKLQEMLNFIREGDTVYIHDFSRLARSTKDLLALVEIFNEKNVTLVSNKEHIDTGTPTGKLMLTMIAAINEFERANILERQREGIAVAVRENKFGRKSWKDYPEFESLYNDYLTRKLTKAKLAEKINVSRPTLNKLIKEYTEPEDKEETKDEQNF